MSDPRPHLSIGEVLSLLQDEFPDITISKIRFLESQGLLNPERTPSGYRKFYDHDVEQLRWVLRQQKDNFLPLKVIKDRLAAGQLDRPASESGVLDLAPAPEAAGDAAQQASRRTTAPTAVTAVTASATAASATGATGATAVATAAPAPSAPSGSATGGDGGGHAAGPSGARPARSGTGPDTNPEVTAPRTAPAARADGAPVGAGTGTGDRSGTRERGAAAGSAPPRPDASLGSSVSLTVDELCAATGVSPRLLAELERFGLVDGRALGPDTVYDDEAMVICRLAVTMSEAGIEARHLRMFKVSAEREAGLYEQLALPKLRTQRPDARQEAVAQVTALTGTAAELHAALLRRALRASIGPL